MSDRPSRVFGLVCVLIGIWIAVYWLYEPRTGRPAATEPAPPRITLDPRPGPGDPGASPAAQSEPALPPPISVPKPAPAEAAPSSTRSAQTPDEPRIRVVPPEFRSYIVQQGDVSFEAIAQRLYKDRRRWEVIARANPLVTSDRLKPGKTVLNIPVDPDNIQGKVVAEGGAATPTEAPSAKTAETTYVVQADDTLWNISKKVYGKGGLWRTIYEANRDSIKNPDRPPAGTVLKIPPKPE